MVTNSMANQSNELESTNNKEEVSTVSVLEDLATPRPIGRKKGGKDYEECGRETERPWGLIQYRASSCNGIVKGCRYIFQRFKRVEGSASVCQCSSQTTATITNINNNEMNNNHSREGYFEAIMARNAVAVAEEETNGDEVEVPKALEKDLHIPILLLGNKYCRMVDTINSCCTLVRLVAGYG